MLTGDFKPETQIMGEVGTREVSCTEVNVLALAASGGRSVHYSEIPCLKLINPPEMLP